MWVHSFIQIRNASKNIYFPKMYAHQIIEKPHDPILRCTDIWSTISNPSRWENRKNMPWWAESLPKDLWPSSLKYLSVIKRDPFHESKMHKRRTCRCPCPVFDMRQLLLFQKVESDGGPFFKVVLDYWKRCSEPFLIYIYGIQCDFMPKSCWKHSIAKFAM